MLSLKLPALKLAKLPKMRSMTLHGLMSKKMGQHFGGGKLGGGLKMSSSFGPKMKLPGLKLGKPKL